MMPMPCMLPPTGRKPRVRRSRSEPCASTRPSDRRTACTLWARTWIGSPSRSSRMRAILARDQEKPDHADEAEAEHERTEDVQIRHVEDRVQDPRDHEGLGEQRRLARVGAGEVRDDHRRREEGQGLPRVRLRGLCSRADALEAGLLEAWGLVVEGAELTVAEVAGQPAAHVGQHGDDGEAVERNGHAEILRERPYGVATWLGKPKAVGARTRPTITSCSCLRTAVPGDPGSIHQGGERSMCFEGLRGYRVETWSPGRA